MTKDPSLSVCGREGQLIATLTDRVPTADLPEGPGDDAALVPSGPDRVLSTDALVEGVHFVRAHPPEWLGWKVLSSNLSDIAAMGAIPEGFTLAAALPSDVPDAWWRLFADGMAEYARKAGALLVGGDIVASPGPAMFTVTCWGRLKTHKSLQRTAARPGHELWVAGHLGRSRNGLQRWLALTHTRTAWALQPCPEAWAADLALLEHLRPDPPLSVGPAALEAGAVAGMDVSDGLWLDGQRLARSSGVDLVIDLDALPPDPALPEMPPRQRLLGGEDYALLLAAPQSSAAALRDLGCARIGEVLACASGESTVRLTRSGEQVEAIDEAPFLHFTETAPPDAEDN